MKPFRHPNFGNRAIELRYEDGEVAIYGTEDGLRRLSDLCLRLAAYQPGSANEHFHLDDYELLTKDSLRGTIAVFRAPT